MIFSFPPRRSWPFFLLSWPLAGCDRPPERSLPPADPLALASSPPSAPPPASAPALVSPSAAPAGLSPPASVHPSGAPLLASTAPPASASAAAPRALPPWVELPLPGFEPVIVGAPAGGGTGPIFLVAHGFSEIPAWSCAWWRRGVGDGAFVVCPRGVRHQPLPTGELGYQYTSAADLEREIAASIAAVRGRFGARVAPGGATLAGFSQGAIFGAELAARAGFFRLILVEGGVGGWSPARALAFREAGGERVLLACGQPGCDAWAHQAEKALAGAGVVARVLFAQGGGHRYQKTPLEPLIYREIPWVMAP